MLSAAFPLKIDSLRSAEPEIRLTALSFACSGFLWPLQKGIAGPYPSTTLLAFPSPWYLCDSRDAPVHPGRLSAPQSLTLPQKQESAGQMQAPDLLLVLKSSFALIPALAVLPCMVFLGPFNASAPVYSISKPEAIFTRRCETWLAFVLLSIHSDERNI